MTRPHGRRREQNPRPQSAPQPRCCSPGWHGGDHRPSVNGRTVFRRTAPQGELCTICTNRSDLQAKKQSNCARCARTLSERNEAIGLNHRTSLKNHKTCKHGTNSALTFAQSLTTSD